MASRGAHIDQEPYQVKNRTNTGLTGAVPGRIGKNTPHGGKILPLLQREAYNP